MEKIKVGEYVRSEIGSFGKVTRIKEGEFLFEDKTLITWTGKVKKHSSKIIDLIEVGDYVNGWKVRDVYLEGERHYLKLTGLEHARIYDDDIKSIVTHEQFNSIKYEVI